MARAEGRHRRRALLALLVVILLGAGTFAAIHSSLLGARTVKVVGSAHVSDATVVKVAGLEHAPPLVDLSASDIASKVEALPWVDTASVSVSWPSTVTIRVSSRTPVAVVAAPGRGYALLDETGRVLEISSVRPAGFPLVLTHEAVPAVGRHLAGAADSLCLVSADMPEEMVAEVNDLRLGTRGVDVDLADGIVGLVGDPTSLHDKFVALATVLAHGGLAGIGTIDLRVPSAPVLIRKH